MDENVPYMPSVANLNKILDAIQRAGVPSVFNLDFLKDLGFTSSNDRAFIKVFKFLGMLDASGHPQQAYKEFVDHTKARTVLAARLRYAYDDLYLSNKEAHTKPAEQLKGWFKTKTGAGDSVATKMATQFKALANYADFDADYELDPNNKIADEAADIESDAQSEPTPTLKGHPEAGATKTLGDLGLVYRIEVHLPDTQNVETYRAIFKALREELMP